jgi:hypothetical protein
MFFSISKNKKDNFPNHYDFDDYIVNTDAGWKQVTVNGSQLLYKGYTDLNSIEENLEQIIKEESPTFLGNFCVIVKFKETNKIITDLYRGFPISFNENEITNLENIGQPVWSNNLLSFDNEFKVEITTIDTTGEIETDLLNEEEALTKVDDILSLKTQNFLKSNTLPIKVFLSGGIDSLLVFSYIQKYTNDYELILSQHIDFDYFWLKNSYTLQKYWGYKQIHHWNEDCILTSGAPGDEFMLRSPSTANMFCRFYNQSIPKLLSSGNHKDSLHYDYFSLDKHMKVFSQQENENHKIENFTELTKFLCNINLNDFQHWHLGKTLNWTPLRDLNIFKIMIRLQFEIAEKQIMDSHFSKKLIERNNPDLLKLLSDDKNSGNYLSNLVHLIN